MLACLIVPCVSANFLIFPSFILLFLYSTVQKSAVQYSYWPATIPGHVTTGKKVASVFEMFFLCLEANFLIFLLLILLSVVLSPLLLARSPEYPQRIRVASVFEPFICLIVLCLIVCKQIFSFFPLSSSSFYTVQYRRVQYSTV